MEYVKQLKKKELKHGRHPSVRPAQANIFNSISAYKPSNNPLTLKTITKEAVTTSLFSKNPTVHGGTIAGQIQNFFVDNGDGRAFLKGKTTEEIETFRSGLVKIMLNDPSSKAALTPHLEMVNQVGRDRLATQEQRAKDTSFESFPEFPEAPDFVERNLSFKPSPMAASAARLNLAEPKPLNKSEQVETMIDWAQREAQKVGKEFSESSISDLREHAEDRSPEAFQQIVRNLLSMKRL